jgi:DNA-binding LytR/AlgR family response regulator
VTAGETLRGRKVLIVEDEYFLAEDLAAYFNGIGAHVVGPVGTVTDALRLIRSREIEAAVLDINLRGERVYPVADLLRQNAVPFVFASGYGEELEPAAYADVPRCIKPVDFATLASTLAGHMRCEKPGLPRQS